MRLAISNIAWGKENDKEMYSYLSNEGIDALEISPTRLFSNLPFEDLTKSRNYAKALKQNFGIDIVSIQSIWYGQQQNIFNSKEDRDFLREYTFKVIDFANSLDCLNIVFGNPKQRNGYQLKYENEIVEFFLSIANYAKLIGVTIALEPNAKVYGTDFLNSTNETIDFIEKISHPNLKLNLDLGSMIVNNENFDIVKSKLNLINHIHISEPYLFPIKKRELHDNLKSLGYSGVVSIEMAKVDSLVTIQNTIKYIKDVLK